MIKTIKCTNPPSKNLTGIDIRCGNFGIVSSRLSSYGSKFAIITDSNIEPLYGKPLIKQLQESGHEAYLFSFPAGEIHKTRSTKEGLENQLFEKGLGRDTCLIAIGGGVVTDIAGFLASTYCRGIPHIMIPTSLMGMVDASIGGKTGVNLPYGKNLVGTTYQPRQVLIDPMLLKTLPGRELKSGLVEIIKYGAIADAALFDILETTYKELLNGNIDPLEQLIVKSCSIKRGVVERDERETGERRILNFGHTIGHALERLSNYTLSHGEAVAIGILVEGHISLQLGHLDSPSLQRIKNLILNIDPALTIPKNIEPEAILSAMALDKKSIRNTPRFVIVDRIGSTLEFNGEYCASVEPQIIRTALDWIFNAVRCN